MSDKIFEAFFWIEPLKTTQANVPNVLWHYPNDVSQVTQEFKEIPEFCFPDLQRVKLEKCQSSRSEFYTFTLTDNEGKRVYGICMRSLFRGANRRFDVKRRTRHCLCIVTRNPFFKLFKTVLLQLHAIALLEEKPGCCRQFIDSIYNYGNGSTIFNGRGMIRMGFPSFINPAMFTTLNLLVPRLGGADASNKEVPILPLFECLGIDRFFKLLSAVLCERRIVFIADDSETLSTIVLAAANMLYPFKWHHTFIPLIPGKLLSYLLSPLPYMIGIRRYLLSELRRDYLDGTVIVDADSGDVRLQGQVHVRDLLGDSGTAYKQASESLDQMKAKMTAGMASIFMGSSSGSSSTTDSSSGSSTNNSGTKDIMVSILSDLRSSVISSRPGNSTISGLFGMLGGGSNSGGSSSSGSNLNNNNGSSSSNAGFEEARMQWTFDADKAIRDNLAVFFVYLFGELKDYISLPSTTTTLFTTPTVIVTDVVVNAKSRPSAAINRKQQPGCSIYDGTAFTAQDSRSRIDFKSFMHRRSQQLGDSRLLITFMEEFIYSQMFERYCDELLAKQQQQRTISSSSSGSSANNSTSNNNNINNNNKRTGTISPFRRTATTTNITSSSSIAAAATATSTSAPTTGSDDSLHSSSNSNGNSNDLGLFEAACQEMEWRGLKMSVNTARLAVLACSSNNSNNDNVESQSCRNSSGKLTGNSKTISSSSARGFHNLTLQYTSGTTLPLAPLEIDFDKDCQYYIGSSSTNNNYSSSSSINNTLPGYSGSDSNDNNSTNNSSSSTNNANAKRTAAVAGGAMLAQIIADVSDSDAFIMIMCTLGFRLQACLASGSRGAAGTAGVRALTLCRILLIEGPECVLSYALDYFLFTIRGILLLRGFDSSSSSSGSTVVSGGSSAAATTLTNNNNSSNIAMGSSSSTGGGISNRISNTQQALDYLSLGAAVDASMHARLVLNLMFDHKKLLVQRKMNALLRRGSFPFLATLLPNSASSPNNSDKVTADQFQPLSIARLRAAVYERKDLLVVSTTATITSSSSSSSASNTALPVAAAYLKQLPTFSDLHKKMNLEIKLPSVAVGTVLLTAPELAAGAVQDRCDSRGVTTATTATTTIGNNNSSSTAQFATIQQQHQQSSGCDEDDDDDEIDTTDIRNSYQFRYNESVSCIYDNDGDDDIDNNNSDKDNKRIDDNPKISDTTVAVAAATGRRMSSTKPTSLIDLLDDNYYCDAIIVDSAATPTSSTSAAAGVGSTTILNPSLSSNNNNIDVSNITNWDCFENNNNRLNTTNWDCFDNNNNGNTQCERQPSQQQSRLSPIRMPKPVTTTTTIAAASTQQHHIVKLAPPPRNGINRRHSSSTITSNDSVSNSTVNNRLLSNKSPLRDTAAPIAAAAVAHINNNSIELYNTNNSKMLELSSHATDDAIQQRHLPPHAIPVLVQATTTTTASSSSSSSSRLFMEEDDDLFATAKSSFWDTGSNNNTTTTTTTTNNTFTSEDAFCATSIDNFFPSSSSSSVNQRNDMIGSKFTPTNAAILSPLPIILPPSSSDAAVVVVDPFLLFPSTTPAATTSTAAVFSASSSSLPIAPMMQQTDPFSFAPPILSTASVSATAHFSSHPVNSFSIPPHQQQQQMYTYPQGISSINGYPQSTARTTTSSASIDARSQQRYLQTPKDPFESLMQGKFK